MPEKKDTRRRSSSGSRHSSHHHHHHHSKLRRFKHRLKRWLKRRKWTAIACIMLVVVAAVALVWMRMDSANQSQYQVYSGRKVDVGSGYRDITYNGQAYRYNNRVTAILYAGIDSDDDLEATKAFTAAPRADSISLVVLDELHERVTIIALNRDTMTDIHRFTVSGQDRGAHTDHLALAFAYGEGGEVSCQNLCQAVSDLLFGVPVSGYVVSNRASIPLLADLIGPVKVVVPNADLEAEGFIDGETVTIDRENLAQFVRSRDSSVDLSNVGRMERQQAYINGAMNKIVTLLTEDTNTAWNFVQEAEKCVLTDITRSRYLNLTKVLKNTTYSENDYYTPEGEQVVGSNYDEFYPDLEALREKVVELFYVEK